MNEYTTHSDHRGEYLMVRVAKGHCLIDIADRDVLIGHKWYVSSPRSVHCKYIAYTISESGKTKTILMHRLLMEPPKGLVVDHRDGNGCNNRRYNLRLCTHAQNMAANHHYKRGKSGLLGVYPTDNGRFTANISWGSPCKLHHLGTFDTPEKAGLIRDLKAFELRGEFARLNYPHLVQNALGTL